MRCALVATMCVCFAKVSRAEPEWLPSPEAWSDQRALYLRAAAELDSGAGSGIGNCGPSSQIIRFLGSRFFRQARAASPHDR